MAAHHSHHFRRIHNSKQIHSTAAHIRLCVLVCVSLKKLEETDYFLL